MADYMFCEVDGVTFRKSGSPESDLVTKKTGDSFTNAFADLTVGNDEEKFREACERYVVRSKAASKKQATAAADSPLEPVSEELVDENDI